MTGESVVKEEIQEVTIKPKSTATTLTCQHPEDQNGQGAGLAAEVEVILTSASNAKGKKAAKLQTLTALVPAPIPPRIIIPTSPVPPNPNLANLHKKIVRNQ